MLGHVLPARAAAKKPQDTFEAAARRLWRTASLGTLRRFGKKIRDEVPMLVREFEFGFHRGPRG
jgi:hypothetical protein